MDLKKIEDEPGKERDEPEKQGIRPVPVLNAGIIMVRKNVKRG